MSLKKMLSAVLAVFLLVQLALVPAYAAEPAVSEDFESYDVGAVYRDGPFSDSDLPAGAQVSKLVQAEQGGRFLRMSAACSRALRHREGCPDQLSAPRGIYPKIPSRPRTA